MTKRKRLTVLRVIQVQRLLIFILTIALLVSVVTRPRQQTTDTTQNMVKLGTFKVAAYCPCVKCCGVWSSDYQKQANTSYVQKTKSGTVPKEGRTVSVDSNIIPLGTHLIIDGKEYIAEDTGKAIRGNMLDLYFNSHEQALQYGTQTKTVYLKKGD